MWTDGNKKGKKKRRGKTQREWKTGTVRQGRNGEKGKELVLKGMANGSEKKSHRAKEPGGDQEQGKGGAECQEPDLDGPKGESGELILGQWVSCLGQG